MAAVENEQHTSSLYKFKLNRAPGRWQYKTSPKPKVTIRKQNGDEQQQQSPTQSSNSIYDNTSPNGLLLSNDIPNNNIINSRSDDIDLDSSGSVNGDVLNQDANTLDNIIESKKLPAETLNVEISTPVDFKDTYYEIATIKTPYTFQVILKKYLHIYFYQYLNDNINTICIRKKKQILQYIQYIYN